jgi:hypothetical protein
MTKISRKLRQIIPPVGVLAVPALVAACAARINPQDVADALYAPRMTLATALTDSAMTVSDGTRPETGASRLLAEAARARQAGSKRIAPASIPLLYNTAWGRRWFTDGAHRAAVRGKPAASCPAFAAITAPERHAAVEQAVGACAQALDASGAAAACECELIALDDMLLAPLDAFAYAPGVDGRLLGLGGRHAGPLVVREVGDAPMPGVGDFVIADVHGAVARGTLSANGRATLELLPDGPVLTGWREREGWRRGRMTERLLLEDPGGRRVIALIGHDPATFARDGARLALWPADRIQPGDGT